jgi:hypothetical protein
MKYLGFVDFLQVVLLFLSFVSGCIVAFLDARKDKKVSTTHWALMGVLFLILAVGVLATLCDSEEKGKSYHDLITRADNTLDKVNKNLNTSNAILSNSNTELLQLNILAANMKSTEIKKKGDYLVRLNNTIVDIQRLREKFDFTFNRLNMDSVTRISGIGTIVNETLKLLDNEFDNPYVLQNAKLDSVWHLFRRELGKAHWDIFGYDNPPINTTYNNLEGIFSRIMLIRTLVPVTDPENR